MGSKYLQFWLVIILLLGTSICFGAPAKIDYSKQGVCIVAEASIREEPSKNGKWLSSLALGETVILKSNPVKDPKDHNTEYIKVKLSDGSEGFVNTWCLVQNAYVAVAHRPVKIYKRPDLLADTNSSFEMLDIVAIDQEKAAWIHVAGENRVKSGWIERVAVRKEKEDIVTAILLRKAIRGKEKTMTGAEMEKIVAGLPNPNNYFAVKMLHKYQTVEEGKKEEATSATDNEEAATEDAPDTEDYGD